MTGYPSFGFVTPENMSLLVDLYELTMADSYLRHGMNQRATFELFIRGLPERRNFLVCAGVESALAYLQAFRFPEDTIAYLRSLQLFSDGFLDYLRGFRFTGEVWAIPEGEIVFSQEPLLEIVAPRIEAQVVETFLLNTLNFQVMIASKAARVVLAAAGRQVVDFSPRRDHGVDAALKVARASFIGGCVGSSCVLAGKEFGIPVYGTMAHSYVMSFPDELSAYRAFVQDFPQNSVLLIDTYDTIQGARHAVTVAREMAARAQRLRGVRIDSGDLVDLSRKVRAIFREADLADIRIFLSGELNEYKVADLLARGAEADAFGVGTELGTSADAPHMGGVYKLVEDAMGYRVKLSAGKATLPGHKQVWRVVRDGRFDHDVVALASEPTPPGARPLLAKVMQDGRVPGEGEALRAMQERCRQQMAMLPEPLRAIDEQAAYPVRLSPRLEALREQMYRNGGAWAPL
ncbi:MAG: nicotinate phosphoribosyltransferase [Armatimonadetes bacterium]|nr:nicotinate phosphoribosyltransferase [Armatimonadota bacterium]